MVRGACVGGRGGGEGGWRGGGWSGVQSNLSLIHNYFIFREKLWINVIDLGYQIYPTYSLPDCLYYCSTSSFCYLYITKTYLYNFDPLKPHFYIVQLGFTGVYIIFLISAQKHRL